jgi:sulfonate transport system ATP-binding protein
MALVIEGLGKTYPNGTRALANVTLAVEVGEIVAVIGGSGCGKSTLLRLVSGLDAATEGQVVLDGTEIAGPHQAVGVVFQEPRLLPWLSVAGNVGFGLAGLAAQGRRARVAGALAKVGLADHAARWPRELSGGQAQRVAIARALITRPSVVLLDEPFSALDAFTRADLQDHLLDLWHETRPTLLLVTHDLEEALVTADRIVVMQSHPGRIVAEMTVDLPRPRDRIAPAFEQAKRDALGLLRRSVSERSDPAESR